MRVGGDVAFYQDSDRIELEQRLIEKYPDRSLRVRIHPDGNALLMLKGLGHHTLFHPVLTDVEPDLVLLHESRYTPGWMDWRKGLVKNKYENLGVVFVRDNTEVWTLWGNPRSLELQSGHGPLNADGE
jgi:hypothetical protein